MKKSMVLALVMALGCGAMAQNQPNKALKVWFDQPTSLKGKEVWYALTDNQWKDEPDRLESAGTNRGKVCRNWDPEWERLSLPIGNGSLGANVMGSIAAERLTLNEKSLWRGGPNTPGGADYYWNVNKNSAHYLKDIRQAFTDGDYDKAQQLTVEHFKSGVPHHPHFETPYRFGSYTTMGECLIETGHNEEATSQYVRQLSLDSALTTVSYAHGGTHYVRRNFISYPDNVLVMQFTADRKGMENLVFGYTPTPVAKGTFETCGKQGIVYKGALDSNGMRFTVRVEAVATGGKVWVEDGKIHVEGADEVCFYLTGDTDYKMNFRPDFKDPKTYVGVNPDETTEAWMKAALHWKFDELLQRHYEDYAALFGRVNLQLNPSQTAADLPTPKRLAAYRKGKADFGLEAIYFQFGRYLLIASSRPGNLPANLQGMWQNNVDAPWRADYHNNINIQMNYWPACTTNLGECVMPLVDYIRTLMAPGAVTAKSYFGARGWTTGVSSNIFGSTAPTDKDDMSFNLNPMAGPWLATHVWDYYAYTLDRDFLKETGYDIIKSTALFTIDYLWHKPDGTYTAAPSTSPEHGPVDEGTTYNHAIAREILLDAIEASRILGVDEELRAQWQEVLDHLAPYQIGRYGQLMEWSRDIDDPKDKHRHVNHLFGLHPGRTISPVTTPELAEASRVVLTHRGDGATGWSMGWKLNQWARLHDGNHAYTLYQNLLQKGTADNLLDLHPPFQIDGNFGGCAGIAEMLLQSHMGFVHLLPALPDAWKEGRVNGLCAKGGFVVDLEWKDGEVVAVNVLSKNGGDCRLRFRDSEVTFPTVVGGHYRYHSVKGELKAME